MIYIRTVEKLGILFEGTQTEASSRVFATSQSTVKTAKAHFWIIRNASTSDRES